MNVIIKRLDETDVSYEQIVSLMHKSFEERLQQGLNFTCSFMSVEQYKEKNADGIVFVALDEDSNELMGSIAVHIRTDSENKNYGYNEFLAVSPKAKRLGIGTKLARACERVVQEVGGTYIMCDTAVGATSSVRYHLKQGFKIIGLRSYSSTNYYSYKTIYTCSKLI